MKLSNQEIAKIAALYYGKKCLTATNGKDILTLDHTDLCALERYGLEYGKLYLKHLEDFDLEDGVKVAKIICGDASQFQLVGIDKVKFVDTRYKPLNILEITFSVKQNREFLQLAVGFTTWGTVNVYIGKPEIKNGNEISNNNKGYYIYQHLINECFALPLWLGPDHELNGNTPIELGIADRIGKLQPTK